MPKNMLQYILIKLQGNSRPANLLKKAPTKEVSLKIYQNLQRFFRKV